MSSCDLYLAFVSNVFIIMVLSCICLFVEKENTVTKKDLQSKYEELKKQKEQMEYEFGLKRAKFKSMYLECEC